MWLLRRPLEPYNLIQTFIEEPLALYKRDGSALEESPKTVSNIGHFAGFMISSECSKRNAYSTSGTCAA
jgi:hypothetical protein